VLSIAGPPELNTAPPQRYEPLGPQPLQHHDLLLQPPSTRLKILPQRFIPRLVPAYAHAELEATTAKQAQLRPLFRDQRRREQRQDEDTRPERQPLRHCGQVRKEDEWLAERPHVGRERTSGVAVR